MTLIIVQHQWRNGWWVAYQAPLSCTCQLHAGPFQTFQAAEAFIDL